MPPKAPLFVAGSLWWLVFFDAAWSFPELVVNVGSLLLTPVCFAGAAGPVFFLQRKAGDSRRVALAKACLLGFLAALPFPVTGTVFGAAALAWAKWRPEK
jgi:hypothetical protein